MSVKRIDYAALPVRRIGIGMIGYGFMGRVHSNAFLKIPYSFADAPAWPTLVAMCGRDEARVADVAARLGYSGYCTAYEDLLTLDEVEIIDVKDRDELHDTWQPFIHGHHYRVANDFFQSILGQHPRRSCESIWSQFMDLKWLRPNPAPRTADWHETIKFYKSLKCDEDDWAAQ